MESVHSEPTLHSLHDETETTQKRYIKSLLLGRSFPQPEHGNLLEAQVLFDPLDMQFPLEGFGF